MDQRQCIVIGAGVAGLAVAALLAKKGYSVTVLEQSATYGGKVGELTVGKAFFDSGPSLCTDPEIIDAIYKKCGKNPRTYWNYDLLPEITRYFWPSDGTQYIMPTGMMQIERSLVQWFGERPKRVRKYTDRTRRAYMAASSYYIDQQLTALSLLKPKALVASLRVLPMVFRTVNGRNRAYFANNKTVQLLNRFATYSGSNPYKAPAVMSFAGIPEMQGGAYLPIGGMRSIAKGLYALCQDMGVSFKFNSSVTSLVANSGIVTAVNVGSKVVPCDVVIYGSDVVRLYELLGDTTAKRKVSKLERSTSAIVFYWEVKGNYKKFGLHNIIFSANYKQEYDQLQRGEVPTDPTIYINITSKLVHEHAEKGTENWFVMVNVPAGVKDVSVLSLKEVVLNKLETMLGGYITILNEEYLSPSRLDASTRAWHGAIYGQATNSLAALLLRPKNNTVSPKNLYKVGGTVHPGGGIPLALRSAIIVARML